MRVPRLLVALAVAGALLSPAFAHRPPAPNFPRSAGFVQAAEDAIQGFTLDEVIAWSDAQFAKRVAWGRYVRYGGTLLLASSLVLSALDWFYNQAKQTTGTSLDTWWNMPDGSPSQCLYPLPSWYLSGRQVVECACHSDASGADFYIVYETNIGYRLVAYDGVNNPSNVYGPQTLAQVRQVASQYCPATATRPPLPDWIQSHPDAADGVKQAVTDYIGDQDAQGNIPQSFGQPLPGMQLDPAPTGNQWWDNPFFNPLEDSDGDGWPDWFEWDTGSDPSNAASQPLPSGDPDGDGYDNATERDAGTDPTDPSSRPDVGQDQDTDGDGLKDSADPCPTDPNNMCEQDQNPDQVPDPSMPTLTPVDLPAFDTPTLPDLAGRFDPLRQNFQQRLGNLWQVLQDRFPVGMAKWVPSPPSVGGGTCDMHVQLQIPDLPPADVDICNNPVMQWAASTGRRLVLASLMVGFLFAVARRASHA